MKTIRPLSTRSTRWPAEVRDALRDLQAALRQLYGPQAPRLLLYGSYARGEANEASDVDVLLVYPEQVPAGGEIQRLCGILADLNLRYQVLIMPEDGHIDIEPLVREYMVLEIPINPVCKPACKGLCPVCGEDLNQATCEHQS